MFELTTKEHMERHAKLHECLEELVADWMTHTKNVSSKSTIMKLMLWSHEQIINPTTKNPQEDKS